MSGFPCGSARHKVGHCVSTSADAVAGPCHGKVSRVGMFVFSPSRLGNRAAGDSPKTWAARYARTAGYRERDREAEDPAGARGGGGVRPADRGPSGGSRACSFGRWRG
ncbi:hypothetical protein D187_001611 [Cystobacter fuscus DSM 2262]|uniref:Uncharacterized protein n=1 Tax=Cystobacter fuscus (strain ATCC 25194 / DSM 2262 / NBRC 100088 / M29) TaxID=1242864 RepID=S9QI36_CYSF2|nr:hypothetical protein D187_001611 [Cystobacter fuscus DSM 2262]